jgi:hypothetical protein
MTPSPSWLWGFLPSLSPMYPTKPSATACGPGGRREADAVDNLLLGRSWQYKPLDSSHRRHRQRIDWLFVLSALRTFRPISPCACYFLVLAVAFNLLFAAGYPAYSGIAAFGDWAAGSYLRSHRSGCGALCLCS